VERLPQPYEELVRAVVLYAKAPKEVEEEYRKGAEGCP
jgi:hypothetical protein